MARKSPPPVNETIKSKMQNVERLAYISLWMAVVFLFIYVIFCVSDDLTSDSTTTTRSGEFVSNVFALIFSGALILTLYYDPSENGNGLYLKAFLGVGILVCVGLSGHELRHNINTTGQNRDKEDGAEFMLAVIGIIFAFLGSLSILINVAMRQYV